MFERLDRLYSTRRDRRILSLFDDPKRFQSFSAESDDLLLDYSKTNLDDEVMDALIALAEARGVFAKRDAMFEGEAINDTEGRAVLHTALRARRDDVVMVDGENVVKTKVYAVLDKMFAFARDVRDGKITASNGAAFTDVVNIGIGGSDLGPVMAVEALAPYCDGPRTHFVSNVDGAHIHDVLAKLDPETTLVIIASKTFTTIETMTNAKTARNWLADVAKPDQHFVAISTAMEKTAAFGIATDRVFGFEDWVGGRYSLWGPIGLSILLAIGEENFTAFLAGGNALDRHFREASPRENLPLLLGLIGIWHRNICDYATRAILPYDQHLSRFPAYLQQLDMESNGKSVAIDGTRLNYETGPVVWGEPGTNGQHAFYQLIHQGTDIIPCEFFIAKTAHEPELCHHHDLLKANCLAQSEALMIGRDYATARDMMIAKGFEGAELERQARHRVFEGNRPSLTIAYPCLTPFVLGQLIALYEHRVFVEGVIWGINSFDQWGVELGKELANALLPMVEGKVSASGKDGSTQGLLAKLGD